jgi:hypothetical protein
MFENEKWNKGFMNGGGKWGKGFKYELKFKNMEGGNKKRGF